MAWPPYRSPDYNFPWLSHGLGRCRHFYEGLFHELANLGSGEFAGLA